jgi:Na+/melibiose symporter-like transporter
MNRTAALTLGMVMIFAATIAILLALMPGPHKPTDYLVIGCVATLLCLLLLFVVLINTARRPDRKPDPETDPSPTDPHPTEPRAQ